MRPQPQQLERTLTDIVVGMHQLRQFRALRTDADTGEYTQQVQLPLSGQAGNEYGFVDNTVGFEYPFLYAPAQRRVDFTTPHFSDSAQIISPTDTLILIRSHVIEWVLSEENWTVGAVVRAAVVAPTQTTEPVAYSAIAHLTFQGYASYAEGNEYQS